MEVQLIDVMGDDLRVCNSARVSFRKESKWDEEKVDSLISKDNTGKPFKETKWALSEADQKLIAYLAKHNHWTPFSHVQITLRERVPIFVARQRFKHMVGFTYNEVSRRYVDDAPEFYIPSDWRGRPVNAKQGSSDEVITELLMHGGIKGDIKDQYNYYLKCCENMYIEMIKSGVAPEQARMVLPQSMYTEYIVTGSLAAWARAYKLRVDPHSQKEIQNLAKMWGGIMDNLPELKYSWQALTT